ncbi:uncharacterized protein [Dysidea avara]|uniref:uncharacterized protein n=1 Tax=Dysidea avara TaxID=196820 RepID=UPI00333419ED
MSCRTASAPEMAASSSDNAGVRKSPAKGVTPLDGYREEITCPYCRHSANDSLKIMDSEPAIYCPYCPWNSIDDIPPSEVENDKLVPPPTTENRGASPHLDVFCPNKNLGCSWSGNLSNVYKHTNSECKCKRTSLSSDDDSDSNSVHSSGSMDEDENEVVVAPMIIMMSEFEQKKMNNEQWYSPVFCTHEQGYQFRLRVDANGWCSGDAVAVVVSLVKGDHDDELEWPFQGVITVQILNHITNSAHSTVKEFVFKDGGYECQRVIDETEPEFGCWCDRFITHSALQYNPIKKSQYLKNDCLYFLVTSTPLR